MSTYFAGFVAMPAEFHIGLAFIIGLLTGSFLNVVIYRLPKRMMYEWSAQSFEWLNKAPYSESEPPGLVFPASHCMACKTPIRAWQNIPVLSFLWLRGKCAACGTRIGWRYPLIELLTACLSAVVVFHFGVTVQAAAGLILTWALVALCFIDFDHQLLPDSIVLPLLWLGLAMSLIPVFTTPSSAILGAIIGYLSFWSVFHLFKLLTGKEGMGHGDFKLMALLGAWFGWTLVPQLIIVSTFVGSIVGISLIVLKRSGRDTTIPFGPYIALAGWLGMLWGSEINSAYLAFAGLR